MSRTLYNGLTKGFSSAGKEDGDLDSMLYCNGRQNGRQKDDNFVKENDLFRLTNS